ncbi:bifunctional 6-phosphofructo-2-kinase/fructose-2,6-bisphosphate 2-phosphatase [Exidia glandulosa HHB12029]|uniref:Bifunctional 6-phosphofructo-2-kinase/fructose-2,6-bisphosphate 2-phosphatase n=1 Tax=Exidia glandulosa HHB12029 TaxID=1314781 RepID=A0A165BIV1_EXIGL|nr:bifunctional 6-phosphofructo-2-kinase/fructose-2,6-bisphosphate 2-phosphatase [Exidia glandulosa HHB12029]
MAGQDTLDGTNLPLVVTALSNEMTKSTAAGEATNPKRAQFGALGPRLKEFDQSSASSRRASRPSSPPRTVVGIGGKAPKPDYSEAKIVVAMVGLPARGKSYLSNKLQRYLQWLEYDVKVFNVGQLRRKRARQSAEVTGKKADHTAAYFSYQNDQAMQLREQLAEESLDMLIQWLKDGGNVGIHDATNSTRLRRSKILERVSKEPGIVVMYIESFCDDPAIIAANVALKVSSGDPDYKNMSKEDAERDFLNRIREYQAVYETITEEHLSHVRIVNVGDQVTMSRIHGYLQSRIVFYLMNLHLKPRSIFFSREQYPDDYANRDDDKFNYRYRGGESYRDVVTRLEPVIMELERQENIMIIGHQAILRCLYAYFHNLPQADLPYIKIPLHTVIKLTPKAYGCDEERYPLPIGAVDTHRPKPKTPANSSAIELPISTSARDYYGDKS